MKKKHGLETNQKKKTKKWKVGDRIKQKCGKSMDKIKYI